MKPGPDWMAPLLAALLLAGCSGAPRRGGDLRDGPGDDPAAMPALDEIHDAVPRDEPPSRFGNPESYVVFGKRYHTLASSRGYRERGIASWYGSKFHGRRTSSGEPYDMYAMTAAHRTLPLPTYVRVTNLENGRSVVVRVNDRGPFHDNRIIDLSHSAARKLGIVATGTGLVEVRAITPGEPEPEPPAAVPEEGGHPPSLYIQVGAFRQRDNAERLRRRLHDQLQSRVELTSERRPDGPLYRVQIGPVGSVELADVMTRHLDEIGIHDSHIVIR